MRADERARHAGQQTAEAELASELFTADEEFPPGPAVSRRRRRSTSTLPDIDTYGPDAPSPAR